MQRACQVADKSSDELEAAILKVSAAAEKSDAERDAELGALTDAVAELRAHTAAAGDLETLARCVRMCVCVRACVCACVCVCVCVCGGAGLVVHLKT